MLLALGNDNMNPIWEEGLADQKGWSKPSPDDSRKAKEDWIKSKYLWKGFLVFKPEDGKDVAERETKYNQDLYEAARFGNLLKVAEALARGADVDWRNEKEGGKTALHICATGKPLDETWSGIECAELLIQNGAKIDTLDRETQTALDCAVCGNGEREMVEYLSERADTAISIPKGKKYEA